MVGHLADHFMADRLVLATVLADHLALDARFMVDRLVLVTVSADHLALDSHMVVGSAPHSLECHSMAVDFGIKLSS